ncbi:MAG: DUF4276 family protein [Gemmataceae bacterium]|nr:DUF4276 family protein [Gemmataceae bacterium]
MKVLFVGEGKTDVGAEFAPIPRPARGVIPHLSQRVCPTIDAASIAYFWREIPVINDKKRARGLAAKVSSAIALALRHQCVGTICVVDRDRDTTRLNQMEEGGNSGKNAVGQDHQVVCGVAVESIEAWTLGAPTAIARVLKVDLAKVQSLYKASEAERFYERSGKEEKKPKKLLNTVTAIAHREDSLEFKEEVAQCTDLEELKRHCPTGFRPFAEKLTACFGPRQPKA